MITYLYVKQHKTTGLKYFGKTTNKNPYNYVGSGLYWSNHLEKYGSNIETLHVWEFANLNECEQFARDYSKLHDIVNSPNWANLKEENGRDGGFDGFRWYNNGTNNQLSNQHPGEGWILGRINNTSTKGFRWYNNGKINMYCSSRPSGSEWQEGMLKKNLPSINDKTHHFFDPAHRKMLLERQQELLKTGQHASQQKWTCPHCGKNGKGLSNYARWHGDKCRGQRLI